MKNITAARIREILIYEPESGTFTWRAHGGRAESGRVAGSNSRDGYRKLKIDGGTYLAHRVAWLYVYGQWPSKDLDHINHEKTDNRIANLREASDSENNQNRRELRSNTSGFRGVCLHKKTGRWMAQIQVNRENKYLGLFDSPDDAHAAYIAAATELHTRNPLTKKICVATGPELNLPYATEPAP